MSETPLDATTARSESSVAATFFNRVAAALLFRDFRILWTGAFMSTIGTWMQSVAQNWLVLTLTGSASFLGLDAFLSQLPIVLFTLIGGVVADRYSRRHLLIASQYIQMLCAFTLTALVYWDVVRVWHILTLSFVGGTAQAFGGPAYQSLIPSLVPKSHLPNAIALNSIQFNLARVIGPVIASAALAALGMVACFGLNGLSFLAVIAALMMLRVQHAPSAHTKNMMQEMVGGLSFVRQQPALVALIVVGFTSTLLGLPLLTLLPVVAQHVFGQGVEEYSRMLAFSGAGAVIGALVVAWLGKFSHMGRVLLAGQALFAVLLLMFAFNRSLTLSHVLLFCTGATMIVVLSITTSLVQLIAPDHMRGRVMSIYMVAFRGGMPLGALLSGWLASLSSAPNVLIANAILLLGVAAYFFMKDYGVKAL